MENQIDIKKAIESVELDLNSAWHYVNNIQGIYGDSASEAIISYQINCAIERAFTTLLLLSETLGLDNFRILIQKEYDNAKKQKDGLGSTCEDPDGDIQLIVYHDIRKLLKAFKSVYGLEDKNLTLVNITDILKACVYSFKQYGENAPASETELHESIENILRCVYPDLKHKPSITKPIKNFEPDTGIPSIKTLIEYKYITNNIDVKRVSEEILADTRGYISRDWDNFIYAIYETKRFKSEKQWNQHLIECGNPKNSQVIVLCGENSIKKRIPKCSSKQKKE